VPERLTILLDQNIPREIKCWLARLNSAWSIFHTSDVALDGRPDADVLEWARIHNAVVITCDEDFSDLRNPSLKSVRSIIRLRVWPTTVEEIQRGLERLFLERQLGDFARSLIVIDTSTIRIRKL